MALPLLSVEVRLTDLEEIERHVNECLDDSFSSYQNPHPPVASSSKHTVPLPPSQNASPAAVSTPSKGNDATPLSTPSIFNRLMTSHKENEAWKEASAAEDRNFRPTKGNGGRRKAPFYKVMTGMPIAVDAFRYGAIPGVTAYFLT